MLMSPFIEETRELHLMNEDSKFVQFVWNTTRSAWIWLQMEAARTNMAQQINQ